MKIRDRFDELRINPSRYHLESWVARAAKQGATKAFRVLDAGAGHAPYRSLFDQVTYETMDFAKVEGKAYGSLDYVCNIEAMPMPDYSYDLVICNQVLEHVPEPVAVLRELARVTKPGSQIWLSAPLFYAEHEQPYDFHRYTQFAWRTMAEKAGLIVVEISWLEGYFGTLQYQMKMAAVELPWKYFFTKLLFAVESVRFGRADIRRPRRDIGMCKNYCVVLQTPALAL